MLPGIALGWGLLSQFPPARFFVNFSALSKQKLAIEYPVNIWQVSPQLCCSDTCQIWTWFKESNIYFCHIENFAYGEIKERSFSNPHSCCVMMTTVMPVTPKLLKAYTMLSFPTFVWFLKNYVLIIPAGILENRAPSQYKDRLIYVWRFPC